MNIATYATMPTFVGECDFQVKCLMENTRPIETKRVSIKDVLIMYVKFCCFPKLHEESLWVSPLDAVS